jgi:hypothetical protein
METYYQVTYKTQEGIEVARKRDTAERGYYLYQSLVKDFVEDGIYDCSIKLEEISVNGVALLRAKGDYKRKETSNNGGYECKTDAHTENVWKPKNVIEALCGMPIEEYNECLDRWNLLTGDKVEHLEI